MIWTLQLASAGESVRPGKSDVFAPYTHDDGRQNQLPLTNRRLVARRIRRNWLLYTRTREQRSKHLRARVTGFWIHRQTSVHLSRTERIEAVQIENPAAGF